MKQKVTYVEIDCTRDITKYKFTRFNRNRSCCGLTNYHNINI